MQMRGTVVVLGLLAVACSKSGDSPAIPPVAAAELTSPPSETGDEALGGFGDDDEAFVDEGGFGAPQTTKVTLEPWMRDAADKMAAHAEGNTRAWDRLAEMTDRFGHRLSGSKSLERAIDWTLKTMEADGLQNVRREKVMVPRWVRGDESLHLEAPLDRELTVLGLGMSVGTKGRLVAPLAVVDHVDAIAKLDDNALAGKIVLINQKMPPYDYEERDAHYGGTVQARSRGPSEAAKKGAKAVLVRSVTAISLDTPHTGSLSYQDGVRKIPAAAVTAEGAEFLARMAERGEVKVALKMGAKTLPDAESGNAIGELVGTEKPEEIVVVGCHIDSWDVGTGASDDGGGCLMAMEGVSMLRELGLRPKRTIRVVLFTNEENGLRGALAYHEAHRSETHVAAIEADAGAGAPYGFSVATEDDQALRTVVAYAPLFKKLGADHIEKGWGGADISPLTKDGVLSIAVRPDGSHYFDLHHSPADTVDKIDPEHLQKNAAAMGLLAYLLAQR